jgi:hypothetical protein
MTCQLHRRRARGLVGPADQPHRLASSIDFETGDQLGMSSSSLPVSLKPIRVQFHTEQCMLFSRASAVFKYSTAAHDVVEVSRSGYRSCSAESPKATFRTGNDAVQLDGLRVATSSAACRATAPPG